jgi:hypothetical protein
MPRDRRTSARQFWRLACQAVGLAASCVGEAAQPSTDQPWEETTSKHFIVRHRSDAAFAVTIAAAAERHYEAIARDLGYTRFGDYWLWEQRATIVLHPSVVAFAAATGAPVWARGKADHSVRTIHAVTGDGNLSESVLPHELAHLIFRQFVGFEGDIPLWLDEGVAQREESEGKLLARSRTRGLMARGRLASLAELTDVRGADLGSRIPAEAFYPQAGSLVGFLVDVHGSERFTKFCRQLRDGRALEDALRFTYPETLRTMQDLERGWKAYLEGGR